MSPPPARLCRHADLPLRRVFALRAQTMLAEQQEEGAYLNSARDGSRMHLSKRARLTSEARQRRVGEIGPLVASGTDHPQHRLPHTFGRHAGLAWPPLPWLSMAEVSFSLAFDPLG